MARFSRVRPTQLPSKGFTMALVSMRELLDHPPSTAMAFQLSMFNNLEQVQALMAAADEVGAPVHPNAASGGRSKNNG